jgi:putative transposase
MPPLDHDKFYHIYNRGNNREDLFRVHRNYEHFLRLYEKYIYPIADTYAWVLMKNHFHLLIRIKGEEEMGVYLPLNSDRSEDSVRLKPNPTRHFSHLFNAYARYYNLKYKRSGALFERPFKRIEVSSIEYFRKLVVYIHTNPVHHGFTENYNDYEWSSYQSIVSSKPTKLQRQEVINWFDDIENLKAMHQMKVDTEPISEILLE